ncbi:hypothetical protein BWQ96_09265 [Gracilariopsis chorda]|uniref:Uncharacterized protein n=1 Tax=Gracilariopsis chorda TaxID=448386 RepID=A0A2V3IG10_9FLOR|nr:hypothetical protein BWQ96_09265 [Gracilariopsis chorda]|eukprot:PXF41025.1 hypothetical protein BWQ96_09265 [Gracilariopsis chorda]
MSFDVEEKNHVEPVQVQKKSVWEEPPASDDVTTLRETRPVRSRSGLATP